MAKIIGLVALLLCSCLAVAAVAEPTGDSASRRLLVKKYNGEHYAAVDSCSGSSYDRDSLIRCCYDHTKDIEIIVKIVIGYGYDCSPDYVKIVLKIDIGSGPIPYHGPGGKWYDGCKLVHRKKDDLIRCCQHYTGDIKLIVKIVIGFGYTDCTEDYVKIILKIKGPKPYHGPGGPWYDHCKDSYHSRDDLIHCCRRWTPDIKIIVKIVIGFGYDCDEEYVKIVLKIKDTTPYTGPHVPAYDNCKGVYHKRDDLIRCCHGYTDDIKIIVKIVIGFGYDCDDEYVKIVLKIKGPGHHRPKPPPQCGKWGHHKRNYVKCCKKEARLPVVDIIDVCIQIGIKVDSGYVSSVPADGPYSP